VRRRECFIFAGQSGGSDLRNHEPGIEARFGRKKCRQKAGEWIRHLLDAALSDSAERGDCDCDLIGGHSERLAMKISAADDIAFVLFTIVANEHQWIIRGAVQFYLRHLSRLRKGIANGAMNLRRASQTVRVLYASILFGGAMGFADFAAFIKASKIACGAKSAWICARLHNARIKSAGAAAKCIERKRRSNIGSIGESVSVPKRKAKESEHALCAVQK